MINGKIKLIINYNQKNSEIILDCISSFREIKNNIIKEFNISEEDSILIKFNDIKIDQLDSQNIQIKIELNNKNLFKENEKMQKDFIIMKNNFDLINKENENLKKENSILNESIKALEENYDLFEKEIISKYENSFKSFNEQIKELIENKLKNDIKNKDNNNSNEDEEYNNKYNEIIKEIDNIKKSINADMNNDYNYYKSIINNSSKEFRELYQLTIDDINDQDLTNLALKNNGNFFLMAASLIEHSYDEKKKK